MNKNLGASFRKTRHAPSTQALNREVATADSDILFRNATLGYGNKALNFESHSAVHQSVLLQPILMPPSLNVLVVEDSPNDAELLQAGLLDAGFELKWRRVETETGYLEHLHEGLDLVISDYQLPNFNGLRALELLKQSGLDIPFILVSGTVGEEIAVNAIQQGATDYLMKDRLARLGPAVTHALTENRLRRNRREVQDAFRVAHAQLGQLLEHSPAVLYSLKVDGEKIIPHLVSENIAGLLGFSATEMSNSNWWLEHLHPEDRARVTRSITETCEIGSSRTEYRLRHKEGYYKWVDDARRLVAEKAGTTVELIGVWTDITERKRAEDVLRQAVEAESPSANLRGKKDLVAMLGLSAGVFVVAFAFDLFEGPIELLVKYKDSAIDDFWGTLIVFSPLFMVFAYRRWKDTELAFIDRHRSAREMEPRSLDAIRGRQRRAGQELVALMVLVVGFTIVTAWFNAFEQPFRWIWENRNTQIDELIGTMLVVALVMIPSAFTFAYRRWHETEAEVTEHQRSVAALRFLHDELDRQVQQRTADLAQVNDVLRAEIAGRKRTEEALLQAKTQTESVLAGMADVYLVLGRDWRCVYVNEAAVSAINRADDARRESVLGCTVWELFPTIAGTQMERELRRAMIERVPVNFEFYYADRDMWWQNRIYPAIGGVAMFATEITAGKKAEAALAAERTLLRTLIDLLPDSIYVKDAAGRFLVTNTATDRLLGASTAADALGKVESDFHTAEHLARFRDSDQRILEGGSLVNQEQTHLRANGTKQIILSTKVPLRDASGAIVGIVGTGRDITESRKLEEQFRQAQKMEAIGTLAGGIAHDFNNILAAITGYTELAKMEVPAETSTNEHLDAVLHGAKRAVDLVRQILAFSRQQEQERRPVQLRNVVNEALKLLRATIPATVEFDVSLAKNATAVLADATQVHQVVMNLCTNAAHAMRDRPGRLTVKLEDFLVDTALAEMKPGLRPAPYMRLSVSDTGHGMDEATVARIFEPFFTTKAPGEGTGLGLSVVHGIMQSHEGAVTVYSQPGEGTTFQLYFPAHVGEVPALSPGPTLIPHGRGERIMYVDDEAPLALLGHKILERLGYTVETRTKPIEALELVCANPGAFDLVVTDQMMPGLMGTDLAKQIHRIRPELPIILVTGYTATLTHDRVQALGIRKLLLKPLTVESIGLNVHQVLTESKTR